MIERYRAAPLDRAALLRTVLTLAGLVALLVLIFFIHQLAPPAMLLGVPILALPALAYASTPMGYAVDERAIYIERKALSTVRVPLTQVTAVRPLPRPALSGAMRVYGTGGLFGWAGRYKARRLGAVSMHATNLDRLILVERRRRRALLISPADPNAFLSGLRRQYETIELAPLHRERHQV